MMVVGDSEPSYYPAIGENIIERGWWYKGGNVNFYNDEGTNIMTIFNGRGTYPIPHEPGATYEYNLAAAGWRGFVTYHEGYTFVLNSGTGGTSLGCISYVRYDGYNPSKGKITSVPEGTVALLFNLKHAPGEADYIRRLT